MTETIICKSCGNTFSGKFCNECGEKVYTDHDKTLSHFFEEAFHFITHFDGKFFNTVKLVFFKPGFVSAAISRGVRKKYFKPVSLFLLGVVIYLLSPALRGLNVRLDDHLLQYESLHIGFPDKWAAAKKASQGIDGEVLAEHFENKSAKVSKILLLIIIPLTGAWLKLLFRRKGKFYFDHFTLGAEISSFYLYFTFLLIPLVVTIVSWVISWFGKFDIPYGDDIYFVSLFTLVQVTYVTAALKQFYGLKLWVSILKSLLFLAGFYLVVFLLYRLILFSIVMLLI